MKRHANPKPDKAGKRHLERVAREAYPGMSIRFVTHGDMGGHRAPRDCTLAFRLVDKRGKYRSNVVWVFPEYLKNWTVESIRRAVDESNGK